MEDKEIQVNFIYNSEPPETIKCKSNEKIEMVCKAFASKRGLNFLSHHFLFNGQILQTTDFTKSIKELLNQLNPSNLSVLVIEKSNPEENSEQNRKIKVNFWFKTEPTIIQCNFESKVVDVCMKFANKIGKNINSLNFIYKQQKLDFSKNFNEIIDHFDNNKGSLEVLVEENNNIEIYENRHSNIQNQIIQRANSNQENQVIRFSQTNRPMFIFQHLPTVQPFQQVPIVQNVQPIVQKDNSCCRCCNKTIIIISIIIAIIFIVSIILAIVFNNKSDDDSVSQGDRCENYDDSSQEKQCIKCKSGYDLYKGECIFYAFIAVYYLDYYVETIQLFNPEKINNIYAMEINGEIVEPVSEFTFNNAVSPRIYFYIRENTPVSLSNFFENNKKIRAFTFISKNMDNFYINDIKEMFKGCTYIEEILFGAFKGQNITNISGLFANCTSMNYLDIADFNTSEVKDMSYLFYGCVGVNNVKIESLISEKTINTSSMYANCFNIKLLSMYGANTRNVLDMSNMFYNCHSLTSLDLSNFDTYNTRNMSKMFFFVIL